MSRACNCGWSFLYEKTDVVKYVSGYIIRKHYPCNRCQNLIIDTGKVYEKEVDAITASLAVNDSWWSYMLP